MNSSECAEIKENLVASGLIRREDKVDFDFLLSFNLQCLLNRLKPPRELPKDRSSFCDELVKCVEHARVIFDAALDPARESRKRWLDMIAHPSDAVKKHRKRPGRPKDPEIARRDLKIYEAWMTERPTYEKLGRDFVVSKDVARKAVARVKRQKKAGRSKKA